MSPLFLQLVTTKLKSQKGFTLIELLVVIVIVGILSAIALPSFLSQTQKARLAEAKTNVGAASRAQQVYFNDFSTFTTNIIDLQIGLSGTDVSHLIFADSINIDNIITVKGWSRRPIVQSVASVVTLTRLGNQEVVTTSQFCQAANFDYWTGNLAISDGTRDPATELPQCPPNFIPQN